MQRFEEPVSGYEDANRESDDQEHHERGQENVGTTPHVWPHSVFQILRHINILAGCLGQCRSLGRWWHWPKMPRCCRSCCLRSVRARWQTQLCCERPAARNPDEDLDRLLEPLERPL